MNEHDLFHSYCHIVEQLKSLHSQGKHIMATLDQLVADVAKTKDLISAVGVSLATQTALIADLKTQLASTKLSADDQAKLDKAVADIEGENTNLQGLLPTP